MCYSLHHSYIEVLLQGHVVVTLHNSVYVTRYQVSYCHCESQPTLYMNHLHPATIFPPFLIHHHLLLFFFERNDVENQSKGLKIVDTSIFLHCNSVSMNF